MVRDFVTEPKLSSLMIMTLGVHGKFNIGSPYLLGLERIRYLDNFKVFGSRFLSGESIILLSLSGSGFLGYPGVGYLYKNCNIGGYPDPDLDP